MALMGEAKRRMSGLVWSNTELAQQIYAGDKRAEAELFTRFGAGVRQILLRVTGSSATAEDLCQETLIVTLQRLRSKPLEDPSRLAAFVAQTARGLALAERRKERRRRTDTDSEAISEMPDLAHGQESEAQVDSIAAVVQKLLRDLPSERDQLLLVRYYLRGEDRVEICRDLEITEASFNVALFRARARFQKLLARRGLIEADLMVFLLA
jgi:RNA polymerase sigma factor (sigma-70 family)